MTATLTEAEGVVEALVAVTGVKDDVGDVIVPGAFARTLATRKPKVVLGHDWSRPIGRTLAIKELWPGDPGLPKTTADGRPWPREAGAVWARYLANLETEDGRKSFVDARFFGPKESTYSIGYNAVRTRQVGGVRHVDEVDLFEYGPVLHPANRLATLQSIKGGLVGPLEVKLTALRAGRPSVRPGTLSRADLTAVVELKSELRVSPEQVFADALNADAVLVMTLDGHVVPAECAVCGKPSREAEAVRFGPTTLYHRSCLGLT